MSTPDSTQNGTCRHCRCSITNRGKGWYHGPERSIRAVPYHFAEPLVVAA